MRKVGILAGALALTGMCTVALFAETPGQKGAAYVGVKKCKMCHMKQYKAWRKLKHAKNYETLVGEERKDPACLKCISAQVSTAG